MASHHVGLDQIFDCDLGASAFRDEGDQLAGVVVFQRQVALVDPPIVVRVSNCRIYFLAIRWLAPGGLDLPSMADPMPVPATLSRAEDASEEGMVRA